MTTRELQTCTFERPAASNTTKIPREDPQRGKKRTNFAAGQGKKKARNFGPPTLRAPFRPTPLELPPPLTTPPPPPPRDHPRQLNTHKKTSKKPKQLTPKNQNLYMQQKNLKFSQSQFAKVGLAGRMHFHPKSISSTDTFIHNTFIQQQFLIQLHFHPMTFSTNNGFIQNITCGTINIVRVCVKASPAEGRLGVQVFRVG